MMARQQHSGGYEGLLEVVFASKDGKRRLLKVTNPGEKEQLMTFEEFFAQQEIRDNGARVILLQSFEHEDKLRGRKISLKPIGNAIYELQVDEYICALDQKTGEFKGSRRA